MVRAVDRSAIVGGCRVVDVLVGGDDRRSVGSRGPRPHDDIGQRVKGVVRRPDLDVGRGLRRGGGTPGRKVVDVVEYHALGGQRPGDLLEQGHEGLGDIDDSVVGPDGHLRVAILVEMEPVETDRLHGRREVRPEVFRPVRRGRVDQAQEVAESVRHAGGGQQGVVLPGRPLGIAHPVDRRVTQRVRPGQMRGVDQPAHRLQRHRLPQRVGVLLPAAEKVGVPKGPVVELDPGEVQPAYQLQEPGGVAAGSEVHDEAVPQPAPGVLGHVERCPQRTAA